MIPRPKTIEPTWAPGTKVRVTQFVRVGHRQWKTIREGVVVSEAFRPIGGMEMGAKAAALNQPTLRIQADDGEITVIAVDGGTQVEVL
ncbi:MAG: hypothetical protein RJA81_2304 [Planctomycetota bacterium]|jgi:hypothetical protein